MKAYLERAREHDEFMKEKKLEFEIGKRHLANMMGESPELYDDQNKIDEAIKYLFPSALYDRRARPMMKPPDEIYPQRKAAEFDEAGRPHHPRKLIRILHEFIVNFNFSFSFLHWKTKLLSTSS
jgi:small subunit ribosomal protein S9